MERAASSWKMMLKPHHDGLYNHHDHDHHHDHLCNLEQVELGLVEVIVGGEEAGKSN